MLDRGAVTFDLREHLRIVFGDLRQTLKIVGFLAKRPPAFDPRAEVAHAPGDGLGLIEVVPETFFGAANVPGPLFRAHH